MKLGLVGLGRMGGNMAVRLARHGLDAVGYSISAEDRARAADAGTTVTTTDGETSSVRVAKTAPATTVKVSPTAGPSGTPVTMSSGGPSRR